MIVVNCAWRQKDIIQIIENIEFENKRVFKYIKKNGIRIFFECNLTDTTKACSMASKAISTSIFGKTLFFNVIDINEYPWIKSE